MKILNIDVVWMGHATFMVKGSKILYFDPFIVSPGAPKADIILITHDHYDHCDESKVSMIRKEETVILGNPSVVRKIKGASVISLNEEKEIAGIKVKAVPAYNVSKKYHPKSTGFGFIAEIDGTTVYHAGDTDFIPEMKGLGKVDIALLPIGGTYTMDCEEAAKAVEAIKPRYAIPMHYGTIPETNADASLFKNVVDSKDLKTEVRVLE